MAVNAELQMYGIAHTDGKCTVDASPAKLVEMAVERNEGTLTSTGCLAVTTGAYTGRSPEDRFIVDTAVQFMLLLNKSLILVNRVVQLGECVGNFPAVDVCFESSGDSRVLRVSLRER